jgi:hypothetical protein
MQGFDRLSPNGNSEPVTIARPCVLPDSSFEMIGYLKLDAKPPFALSLSKGLSE